jgi:hypothetical protein
MLPLKGKDLRWHTLLSAKELLDSARLVKQQAGNNA